MVKKTALVLVLALAALLLYAATRPDSFRVQRSTRIAAPPEKVHALINDLHRFNGWNPFGRKDPNLKGRYRGPDRGPGAVYEFEGNQDVGSGRLAIVEPVTPTRVSMMLDMLEPLEGHNDVEFTLEPQGDATEVTWAMHGPSPYIAKLMGLFFDMDGMIGRDFEAGLADLKRVAERP